MDKNHSSPWWSLNYFFKNVWFSFLHQYYSYQSEFFGRVTAYFKERARVNAKNRQIYHERALYAEYERDSARIDKRFR